MGGDCSDCHGSGEIDWSELGCSGDPILGGSRPQRQQLGIAPPRRRARFRIIRESPIDRGSHVAEYGR